MKKSSKSNKSQKRMTSQPVSKNMKSTINALTKFVTDLVSEAKSEDFNEIWNNNIGEISKVLSSNLPKEKVKKRKDNDAPKRGKSSYIFFCIDNRQKIKDNNKDMTAKDITKELGRMWRDLPEKSKKTYEKQATDDKNRYTEEMSGYVRPAHLDSELENTKKRKGPKRGLSSYIFFCKEQRPIVKENNSNLSAKEITTELGRLWKTLDDTKKKPYDKLAKKDKKRYETEKAEFTDNDSELDNKSTSKCKTGYILFCQEERKKTTKENPKMSSKEITSELGRLWKALTEKKRSEYKNRLSKEEEIEDEEIEVEAE